MKKYILAVAAVSAIALSAGAASEKGFYMGVRAGLSSVSGKIKDDATVNVAGVGNVGAFAGKSKNKSGFVGALVLGHKANFGKGHFAGEFLLSYDTSKAQIGTFTPNALGATNNLGTADTAYKVQYQPRFGLGLAAKGGFHFTPDILGFVRLGLDYNFGKTTVDLAKDRHDSVKVWSVVPGVGVEGKLNEKVSWNLGVDYKVAFNITKNNNNGYKTKPKALQVQAGVSYHF